MDKQCIPLKKAMLWLLLSVGLISGTTLLSLLYYRHVKGLYAHDDTYNIVAIMQSTPHQEMLKTEYLAEQLNLSRNHPTNLYQFNSKEAQRKLLENPLVKEAIVKKVRPGMVYIDYTLRQPIAFLIDLTNTAMDRDGVIFPFKPFFTPKLLPEIYLGLAQPEGSSISGGEWGSTLKGNRVELALSLLDLLTRQYCSDTIQVRRIDVSKADASSCGQRQIIVIIEERVEKEIQGRQALCLMPRIIRLNPDDYLQGLANYTLLASHLKFPEEIKAPQTAVIHCPPTIVDLRMPQLGFIAY